MGHYVKNGAADWRVFEGSRASGISFLLANGQSGEIIDPTHLRTFYTRVFYADQIKSKQPSPRRKTTQSR